MLVRKGWDGGGRGGEGERDVPVFVLQLRKHSPQKHSTQENLNLSISGGIPGPPRAVG